jgi:hypothetical protein
MVPDDSGSVTRTEVDDPSCADGDSSYSDDLATVVRLVGTGRLHPEVGSLTDWTDTAGAITELRARRIRGNAVLEVTR